MGTIKLSEVKKQFLESLKPLEEFGYKIKKTDFCIEKKDPERILRLSFLENHYYNEIQIIPSVQIQLKALEDIICGQSTGYSASIKLRKLIYWEDDILWDDFSEEVNNNSRYFIHKYEDINEVSIEIQKSFKEYGLKYINEYGTVEGIHKLLNSDPTNPASSEYHPKESAWWHSPGFHFQSIMGLIAAKFADNGRDYEMISKIYTERINQHIKDDTMNSSHTYEYFKTKKLLDLL